ncbi:MAG: T9SS type A sorting domain-containing protein [Flavobacteriales bacterium]|nr:T9SS type A sorting domain-containing protein [Flavobacteriales bacterium]
MANPGTSVGTGTELQINASITASTNVFGVYDWTSPATVGYYKMKVRTTATGTGTFAFAIGTNSAANTGTGYSGNYANHLGVFWITYAAGSISSVTRRNAGANTAVTGSGLAKDTDQLIEVYANNAATSTTYSKGGTSYTLNSQTWDLWVDGTKVSPANGWAKAAGLAAGTNLSGIAVYAETSATNNGFAYIDDLEYSNTLPACTAPTTQASSITAANIQTADLDLNWTNGNGAGRVIKMNTSNSFTAPANGSNPTANAAWQNSGEQVVFNGTGGGPIAISNLTQGTNYYFRVYEYCDAERTYNTTTATNNPNNFTTAAGPGLLATTLTAFGAQCVGSDYGPNSFTITGANLTTADVTVSSLSGYTFATASGGPYNTSLSISQGGGAFSQAIYVLFSPTLVQSYDGSISVGGGGASTITVAASGSGITSAAPTLITPSSSAITATTATLGADLSSLNCSTASARGIEWSLNNGFTDGSGTTVGETGTFGTGVFTESVTGLPGNSTIYWKAYATNGNGTTRTSQQSFTTSQEYLSVGDISIIAMNGNSPDNFAFVNWVDINPNMVIKFTDNGFNGTAPNSANTALNARGTENFVSWKNTTDAVIPAGTVIKIEGITASIGTASISAGLSGLTTGGEQIFAYQGSATSGSTPDYAGTTATTTFSGTILYGIHMPGSGSTTWLTSGSASSNDSYLPTELNVANGNIVLAASSVGGQYTGTRSALGSIIAYRNLVNNPANWTTVTSGFVTVDQTAFSINPNPATQIVITAVNGGVSPSVNTPFSVTFEVRDASNNAAAVAIDTDFSITLNTGSGSLTGTLSGTITAGNGSLTISGMNYDTAESVTIDVTAVSGMTLTADSETFTVADAADHVVFVALDNYVYTSNNIPTFNVQTLRPDNSLDVNYNGSATISLVSGTGTILGTLTKTLTAGQALFNDISFDTPGVKQIDVVIGALPTATSFNVTVSSASLTEVYLPQAIEGASSTNSNRMPYAFRVTLDGLKPNSTFRYYPGAVISSDLATSNGAGNAIFAETGGFVRSSGTSLGSVGNYGEFTTNGSGSYTGWFILEPTGNSRFTSGNDVYMRLMLNNGNDGTATSVRLTTTNTARVHTFGALAANGTALRGSSSATARNFVLLYDNETGTGRPIAATYVESDGSDNTTANSYPSFYETNVNGVAGAYAVLIPNTLANGIRRIEQRQLSDAALAGCAATDADGVWPSGANTVNPNGGTTTVRVITSTDAALIANPEVCGNYIDDNCDGNVDELCPGNFTNDIPGGAASVAYSSNVVYPNCYPIIGDNTTANNSAESGVYSGPDSWYKFVAQSSAVSITLNSATMDDAIALYSKSGLTYTLIDSENSSVGAADYERLNVSGLTPGTTYYVSVGAASGVTGGTFTLCIQHLMPSGCSYTTPVGGFPLCNNYKAIYRGATSQGVTYNFNFTGIGGGASGTSSVNGTNGLIVLSNPSLQLRYDGIYNVQVDVNYALQNSAGGTENIFVAGTLAAGNCGSVTMATQPIVEVKNTQICPATLLRSNYLIGVPVAGNTNACGAVNYTYEFTQLDACGGTTNGLPVEYVTLTPTPYLKLGNLGNFANTGYWRVRIRPNFSYGSGSYGPYSDISVNNTAASVMSSESGLQNNEEKSSLIGLTTALYPNPNNGEQINLNLTGLDSETVGVRIVNALGQVVFSTQYVVDGSLNTVVSFDAPLNNGIYFVEFKVNDHTDIERMIVQH